MQGGRENTLKLSLGKEEDRNARQTTVLGNSENIFEVYREKEANKNAEVMSLPAEALGGG